MRGTGRRERGDGGLLNAAHARVVVGVACKYLAILLMNQALFPLFDATFTYARDISVVFSAVMLIALSVVAMWRPRDVRTDALCVAAACMAPLSFAGVAAGVAAGIPWLLTVSACLCMACRSLASLMVDMAAVCLPVPRMVSCVVVGVLVAYGLDLALVGLDPWVAAGVGLVALPLAMVVLARPLALPVLGEMEHAEPAAELSVTRPASFLPLTSTLYVFQFVMFVAFGFSLRFGEVDGSPSFTTALAVGALALVLVWALVRRDRVLADFDGLANVVVIVLVAGIMLACVRVDGGSRMANTLLTVGSALYNVLIMSVLVALAGRNRAAAFPIFGWANGMGALGTTLGAFVGISANALVASEGPAAVSYMLMGFLVLLVAYALFTLRSFSFRATIEGVVEPDLFAPSSVDPQALGEEAFLARCHQISVAHGLTPREEETFAMLARGRNREYIENALHVSRNTVKAHVKHVYAKLAIHSHQELIDLVD